MTLLEFLKTPPRLRRLIEELIFEDEIVIKKLGSRQNYYYFAKHLRENDMIVRTVPGAFRKTDHFFWDVLQMGYKNEKQN